MSIHDQDCTPTWSKDNDPWSTMLVDASTHLRSHARIAHLVAARVLNRLLHVADLGWFYWDGTRFAADKEDKLVIESIISVIRELAADGLADKSLNADLLKCQSASGLAGVAKAMSTIKGIRASEDDLDPDPLLLNVANGVIDLRELASPDGNPVDWRQLTLYPHDPKYRMTHITRAGFDDQAKSLLFEEFLGTSLPDLEVRAYLQRALGIGIVGVQLAHLLPILEGTGRNGKGVFYQAVHWALGEYSHVAPSSLFDLTKGDPNRPNPAFLALRGKRLVFVSETAKLAEMDSALIKRLTGGDPITGRLLHKNGSITFDPSHLLVMITNSAPRLPADDPAVWARVRRVPWTVVVPPEKQDPDLQWKMHEAADAILAWCLSGLAEYRAYGLEEPQSVVSATEEYQADQDTVALFIEDRCEECADTDGSPTRALHIEYRKFCRGNGVMPQHMLGEREFGRRLDTLGYPGDKGSRGRRFRQGLKLLPDDSIADFSEAYGAMLDRRETDAAPNGRSGSSPTSTGAAPADQPGGSNSAVSAAASDPDDRDDPWANATRN